MLRRKRANVTVYEKKGMRAVSGSAAVNFQPRPPC